MADVSEWWRWRVRAPVAPTPTPRLDQAPWGVPGAVTSIPPEPPEEPPFVPPAPGVYVPPSPFPPPGTGLGGLPPTTPTPWTPPITTPPVGVSPFPPPGTGLGGLPPTTPGPYTPPITTPTSPFPPPGTGLGGLPPVTPGPYAPPVGGEPLLVPGGMPWVMPRAGDGAYTPWLPTVLREGDGRLGRGMETAATGEPEPSYLQQALVREAEANVGQMQVWPLIRERIGREWAALRKPTEEYQLPGVFKPTPWSRFQMGPERAGLPGWQAGDVGLEQVVPALKTMVGLGAAALHDVKQLPVVGPPARVAAAALGTVVQGIQGAALAIEEMLAPMGQEMPAEKMLPPLSPERHLTEEQKAAVEALDWPWWVGGDWLAAQTVLKEEQVGKLSVWDYAVDTWGENEQTEIALRQVGLMGYSSYPAQIEGLHRVMAGEPVESALWGMTLQRGRETEEQKAAVGAYVEGIRRLHGDEAAAEALEKVRETGVVPGSSDIGNEILFQVGLDPLNILDIGVWARAVESRRLSAVARYGTHVDEVTDLARAAGAAGARPVGALAEAADAASAARLVDAAEAAGMPGAVARGWLDMYEEGAQQAVRVSDWSAAKLVDPPVPAAGVAAGIPEAGGLRQWWGKTNPFRHTPEANQAGLANVGYQVMDPIVWTAESGEEAAAMVRMLAEDPQRLVPVLGDVPVSVAAGEAQQVIADVVEQLDEFGSLKRVDWDPLAFANDMDEALMGAAGRQFDVSEEGLTGYRRFAEKYRHWTSQFYMTFNPGYHFRNLYGDVTTMAWDGLMTFAGQGKMDEYFDAFGPTTRRIAGEAASQLWEAGEGGANLAGQFKRYARGLEEGRYRRAFYGGLQKFMPQVWEPEVARLVDGLGDVGLPPGVADDLQRAMGRRVSVEEMHALVDGLAGDQDVWVDVYKYLPDPDALSPGMVVELEGKLNAAGTLDEAHGAIDEMAEAVGAQAAKAYALDPTPPGRRTWGKYELAQDFWEEKTFTEPLAEQFGMPAEVLQAQLEEYRTVMAQGDAAVRAAGERLAATMGAEYDEGAGQLARYYSGEAGTRKLETRAAVDALRRQAWDAVRAGEDPSGVWPVYFSERNRLWQESHQFSAAQWDEAVKGVERLGAGETVEMIVGRPMEDVVKQSLEQLRAMGRDVTARERRLRRMGLEDFDFEGRLDANRLGVDMAKQELARRMAMVPGRDALEIVQDADARVSEMGQAAALAQEQAQLRMQAGQITKADYEVLTDQIWGQYFTDAPQVYALGMAEVSELPMSAGAQQRALVNMGWPPDEVGALSGVQRQAALAAGVRWDSLVGGPEMPIEQAIQGTAHYVVERAGMDLARMADWTPDDLDKLEIWARQLAKEAGDRSSQAARVSAAVWEGAAEAAAGAPQRVTAGMDLAWPAGVDDVARSMGLQPKTMTAEDWFDVAAECHRQGNARLGTGALAEGAPGVPGPAPSAVRAARARGRELKWLGRADAQETAGWMLREAGYAADELEGLSWRQQKLLIEEITSGELRRAPSGNVSRIGGVDPARRTEVMVGLPRELQEIAWGMAAAPEEAQGYRWLELGEAAQARAGGGALAEGGVPPSAAQVAPFAQRFPVGTDIEYTPAGAFEGTNRQSGRVIGHRVDPTTGDMFAQIETPGGLEEWAGDTNAIRRAVPQEAAGAGIISGPGMYDVNGFPVFRVPERRSAMPGLAERVQGMVPEAQRVGLGGATAGFEDHNAWVAEQMTDVGDMFAGQAALLRNGTVQGADLNVPEGVMRTVTRKEGSFWFLELMTEQKKVLVTYWYESYPEAKRAKKAADAIVEAGLQGQGHVTSIRPGNWTADGIQQVDARAAAQGGYFGRPTLSDLARIQQDMEVRGLEQVRGGITSDWGVIGPDAAAGGQAPRIAPDQARVLHNWMDEAVLPQLNTAKVTSTEMARDAADGALLDYVAGRRMGDEHLGLVFPYSYWRTRNMRNWALRALQRPGATAGYTRYLDYRERKNRERGYRARFEGKEEVPARFLPEWMGQTAFVDPMSAVFAPMQLMGRSWGEDPAEARNVIEAGFRWSEKFGMRPYGFLEWPLKYYGIVGDQEELGYFLPQTGVLEAATAGLRELAVPSDALAEGGVPPSAGGGLLGRIPPGGVSVERAARRAIGLPEQEPYGAYRVGRMLSDIAAERPEEWEQALVAEELQRRVAVGELDLAEAMGRPADGLAEPAGAGSAGAGGNVRRLGLELGWSEELLGQGQALLREAVQKAALERGVSTLTSGLLGMPVSVYPRGERRQIELQREARGEMYSPLGSVGPGMETAAAVLGVIGGGAAVEGAGSREALQAFQAQHPEMLVRSAASSLIGASEYEGMTPEELRMMEVGRRARAEEGAAEDAAVDAAIREEPWNREGAQAAVDALTPQPPLPTVGEGEPAEPEPVRLWSVYGANPGEVVQIRQEQLLNTVGRAAPRYGDFVDEEGAPDYEAWQTAVGQFYEGILANMGNDPTVVALAEDLDIGVGELLRGVGREQVEGYWRRNDTALEAVQRVWEEEIYAAAWERYHGAVEAGAEKSDAWDASMERVGIEGPALVDRVMEAYPGRWTREELAAEYEGLYFPGPAEVAHLRKPPAEQELGDAQEAFWQFYNEGLPPGKLSQEARAIPLVQTLLDADTRGMATAEQYAAALRELSTWAARNEDLEAWGTPAEWAQARAENTRFWEQVEGLFPNIGQVQERYFDRDKAGRRQYLEEHPELKEYWDFRDWYAEEYPTWGRFYRGETTTGGGGGGTGTGAWSAMGPVRRELHTDEYIAQAKAENEGFKQLREEMFPGIMAIQSGYYEMPKALRASYLQAFPELQQYWDLRKVYAAQFPVWGYWYTGPGKYLRDQYFGYGTGGGWKRRSYFRAPWAAKWYLEGPSPWRGKLAGREDVYRARGQPWVMDKPGYRQVRGPGQYWLQGNPRR